MRVDTQIARVHSRTMVANTIRRLRRERSYTQAALAAICGVSVSTVHKWESGRCMPTTESLRALSACFSVSLDYLMSHTPEVP